VSYTTAGLLGACYFVNLGGLARQDVDVNPLLRDLDNIHGTVLILGGTDSGKTTLAYALFDALVAAGRPGVAHLDCDVGQGTLGPPTTIGLRVSTHRDRVWHRFVGSISPRGHFLPAVVGAYKLQQQALALRAGTVVVDTTGMVAPEVGGVALKRWKIELLQPAVVVALTQGRELDPIVAPLRRDGRVHLIEQRVSPLAVPRPQNQRIEARRARWHDYFADAQVVRLPLHELVLWGGRRVRRGQVVGLLDADGFALALGLIQGVESASATLEVLAPLAEPAAVRGLGLGNLCVDPETGEETKIA